MLEGTPRVDEAIRSRVEAILDRGWIVQSLANAFGVDRDTVARWRDEGVKSARGPMTLMALNHRMFDRPPALRKQFIVVPLRERLSYLLLKGWTLQAIADELQVRHGQVSLWNSRGAGRREKTVALALGSKLFDRKPPKKRRYGNPDPRWKLTEGESPPGGM